MKTTFEYNYNVGDQVLYHNKEYEVDKIIFPPLEAGGVFMESISYVLKDKNGDKVTAIENAIEVPNRVIPREDASFYDLHTYDNVYVYDCNTGLIGKYEFTLEPMNDEYAMLCIKDYCPDGVFLNVNLQMYEAILPDKHFEIYANKKIAKEVYERHMGVQNDLYLKMNKCRKHLFGK